MSLPRILQIGIQQGRENPRLLVCYAGSFISRADLTLVATFVSLWLQRVGRNEGLDGPEALAKAGLMFALIQGSSLLWAPIAGVLIDRYHRLACVVAALLLGAIGYTLLGLQEHPFSPIGYLGCVLVGVGQMSVILAVTGLLGQETPLDVRGSVIGLAGLCGSIGILVTSLAGGYLFDHWRISGPIILVGLANLAAFIFAFAGLAAEWPPAAGLIPPKRGPEACWDPSLTRYGGKACEASSEMAGLRTAACHPGGLRACDAGPLRPLLEALEHLAARQSAGSGLFLVRPAGVRSRQFHAAAAGCGTG